MAKTTHQEAPAPTLFERLDALAAELAGETVEGVQPEVVRLALLHVIGGIDHVRSALGQVEVSKIAARNTKARADAQEAQRRREEEKKK